MVFRSLTRSLRQRSSVAVGAALVVLIAGSALLAPLLAPHDPAALRPADALLPPAWDAAGNPGYLLGTDQLGRDVLSLLMHGARTSLTIAPAAVLVSALFGTLIGLLTGYYRGVLDSVIMRLADIQLAFPFVLLALAILAASPSRSSLRIIVVLAIADWVIHARVVRSRVLLEREKDYVAAARALGGSGARIMFGYILPAVIPTVVVLAMVELGTLMLLESILAFIGLGVNPPEVSWGSIMASGRENITTAWWLIVLPGAAIFLSVLGVNLLADGLADKLDLRLRLTGGLGRRPVPANASARGSGSGDGTTARDADARDALLSVRNLRIEFAGPGRAPTIAVADVSFDLRPGERLGIVGESGSGKTVTALSILGLLDPPGGISAGSIRFRGRELVGCSARALNRIRGNRIAMIFQDPGTSLNPTLRVRYQLSECLMRHQGVDRARAHELTLAALAQVNIPEPERVADSYPFQLSGGMQQRVMIAMAMSCQPALLIADEPTTALDVTTQAQIMVELDRLVRETGTSVILITHDLGVVAEFTDRTIVMYGGTTCEVAETRTLLDSPRHPYTRALVRAVESLECLSSEAAGVAGEPLGDDNRPDGCPFAPRCPHALDVCRIERPRLQPADDGRLVACHVAADMPVALPRRAVHD